MSIPSELGNVDAMKKHTSEAFVRHVTDPSFRAPVTGQPLTLGSARTAVSLVQRAERDLHLDYEHQFRAVSDLAFEKKRLRASADLLGLDYDRVSQIATALGYFAAFVNPKAATRTRSIVVHLETGAR